MTARGCGITQPILFADTKLASVMSAIVLLAIVLLLAAPAHAQSSSIGGEVALASQLVDRGLAITPATPVLQGEVSWTSGNGWSLGLAGGVEVRSPGHLVMGVARVSRDWFSSGDWRGRANLAYYDYQDRGGRGIPDRVDAGVYVSYRDTVSIGISAIRVDGDQDRRWLGAADVGLGWPLSSQLTLMAGAGVAEASVRSGSYGYGDGHGYGYGSGYETRAYGYGNLGLAWSRGGWRLRIERNLNSLGERRAYGNGAPDPWVATLSRAF